MINNKADFLSLKNCEDPLRKPMLVPSGRQVCCDMLIKNLAETALEIAGIRPGTREFRDVRRMGKVIRDFLQKHYEKAFEVLTAQIDITQRTNYKGRKICTWVTNGIHFAAYETPGLYNIHDKLIEEYYDSIANKETGNKRRPKVSP
ncbi:hypothetical protein WR25_10615 [Diploscapter pachys]|uniref:Uncharacterized protein n=1 Tax=Diploscapter pachys TaxID=2018661 RepID=A0A2A2JFJ8_9BILA|nr:hypothetical protein WR25_10615 [Diploscapter pachys]